MNQPRSLITIVLLLLLAVGCASQGPIERQWPMGPGPGDVYRESTYTRRFGEVDPKATNKEAQKMKRGSQRPRRLVVDDLDGAVQAEVSVQYWGGHSGTAGQVFRVNDSDWFNIPQPTGTPTRPQYYYRTVLGDNPVQVPLELLREGVNTFVFTAGRQIRYSFNWGLYWIYSFTVRTYYDRSKPHVGGKVISPRSGQTIGERPTITAEIDGPPEKVKQVDFIAMYEDFDWEGNGLWRQWHWQYRAGKISRHLGTATEPPWSVTWDTTWVPDQDKPISIMARVVGADGTISMTPAVKNVKFKREGRSVKMYRTPDLPQNFSVRIGKRKSCFIDVTDSLEGATEVKLLLSTWSADHADEIGLNGKKLVDKVGLVHDVSFDAIPVPLELVKPDANEFYIYATTEHHAAEVNWPGPVLLIEFDKNKPKPK